MKIAKNNFLVNFSYPHLGRLTVQFTSGWIQYRARREIGDSQVGLWRQYSNASLAISLFFRCFSCAEEENCVDENMNGIIEYSALADSL